MSVAHQPRLVSGPEAVKAMDRARRLQDHRDQWPYEWLCPSAQAKPVFRTASIEAPAVNTLTEILAYAVPSGLQFALCGIIQVFSGAGYIPGDQDISWTLDTDSPIGIAAVEGNPLPGLNGIIIPLGGFVGTPALGGVAAPWMFQMPFILKPNQVLRSKAFLPTNNPVTGAPNGISAGSPNWFFSVFSGFTWPV